MHRRTHTFLMAAAAWGSCAGLTAYGFVTDSAGAAAKPSTTLTILVTNDDGVTAPGINATVQALTALPHTKVTVVAPLTNQSGTGAKMTAGTLTVTDATATATLGGTKTAPTASATVTQSIAGPYDLGRPWGCKGDQDGTDTRLGSNPPTVVLPGPPKKKG